MNTIQEVYNDILMTKCENKTCFYYRHFIAPDAKTFIKQYFQDGQKDLDQDIIHYIDNNILDNMRIEHMKSAFLMGV